MKKICSILMLGVVLFASSCQDDISTTNTNIDYRLAVGLPIGEATFGIANLLEKVYSGDNLEQEGDHYNFVMDSEGEFSFRDIKLLEEGVTVSAGEDFDFPAELSSLSDYSGSSIPFKVGKSTFIEFPSISTTGNQEKIDSAAIEKSTLFIRLNKPDGAKIKVNSFKIKFPIKDYETREPIVLETSSVENDLFGTDCYFDINDFFVVIEKNPLDPTKGGFTFDVEIDAEFEGGTINSGDKIGYDVTYTIFDHKVVYGTFTADANLARTHAAMSFNLLRDLNNGKSEGALLFEEVRLFLTLKNYDIGVDLKVTLDSMRGFRRDDTEAIPHEDRYRFAMFQNGTSKKYSLNAERPEVPFTGIPAQTVIKLDNDQGRLSDIFQPEFQPDMFDFFFAVDISNATGSGFLTKDAKIECDIKLEVPVNLRSGSYYVYTDTIKGFNLGETDLTSYIDEAELGLMFTNGMPMCVDFSLCLHDAVGNIINSDLNKELFEIESPERNNIGEVDGEPVVSENFRIPISSTTLKQLQEAAYITYSATVKTDDESTYFKDSDSFAVKLKLFAKGGYTGDILGE